MSRKRRITLCLLLILFAEVVVLPLWALEPAAQIKIVMTDGSILTGSMLGINDENLFLERSGKARTYPLSKIMVIFDDRGNQIYPSSGPSGQVPAETAAGPDEKSAAQSDEGGVSGGTSPAGDRRNVPASYLELFLWMSMGNSYTIGTPLTRVMNDTVQDGSPAFMNFGATWFMGLDPESSMLLGAGMSMNMPPSHSI